MALNLGTLVVSFTADVRQMTQGFGKATAALDQFKQKAESLNKSLGTTQQNLTQVGSASGAAGKAVSGAAKSMKEAKDHAHQLSGSLMDVQTQLSLMFGGIALSAVFTRPFMAAARAASKASIGFEDAFAGVRKTVDATEEEFASLASAFRRMSQELPTSAEEFAQIGTLAGQLGVHGVRNIQTFTDVVAKLGDTTNLSLETAATSIARFANIMDMPISNAERLGSTIVHLGNNLATTESEIVELGLRMAGAGRQIGLTESQIMAFAGAVSSVGIDIESGGTAMSRVFARLANAVADGGQQLEFFAGVAGVTSQDFARAFKADASQAIVTFIKGLRTLQDSGANVFAVLEAMELGDIRVRDALLRTAGASGLLARSLDLASYGWRENTALSEEARKRNETTARRLQVLAQTYQELGRQIGDLVINKLGGLIESLRKLGARLQDLPDWVKGFGAALAALLAVVGPVFISLAMLSAVLMAIRTMKLLILSEDMIKVARALVDLGKAAAAFLLRSGPLIIEIAGLAVVAGLLVASWKEAARSISATWNHLIATVAMGVDGLILGVRKLQLGYAKTKAFFLPSVANAEAVKEAESALKIQEAYFKTAQAIYDESGDAMVDSFFDLGQAMSTAFDNALESIKNFFSFKVTPDTPVFDFAAAEELLWQELDKVTESMNEQQKALLDLLATMDQVGAQRMPEIAIVDKGLKVIQNMLEGARAIGNVQQEQFALAALSAAQNMRTIPKYARGGIVTRPTLAMIGEAGPEAVVPLSGRGGGFVEQVEHSGVITVRGVNNQGQLVGAMDVVMDQLAQRIKGDQDRYSSKRSTFRSFK